MKDGTERRYYPDGTLKDEITYLNGLPNGVTRRWHPNGVLAMEIPTKMGEVQGVVRQWNRTGKLLGSYEIKDGNGLQMLWAENGQLIGEIPLLDGKMTGRQRAWFEDGDLAGAQYWIEGRKVSKRKYLESCRENPRLPRYDEEPGAKSSVKPPRQRARKAPGKRSKAAKKTPCARSPTGQPTPTLISLRLAALIADGVEARKWIESGKPETRSLGELPFGTASMELLDEIYSVGAREVLVLGIDRYPDGAENSGRLLIRLPTDRRRRRQVFAWCREKAEEQGYDGEVDTGQSELFVMLD